MTSPLSNGKIMHKYGNNWVQAFPYVEYGGLYLVL